MLKLIAFAALAALAAYLFMRWRDATPPAPPLEEFSVAPETFSVRTTGWTATELDSILSEFAKNYSLPADSLHVAEGPSGTRTIEATRPLAWSRVLFLVNYLQYPRGFELAGREIGAIARVTLSERAGIPAELSGRRATIYLPANDTEYDLVYMRVEPASHFEISFTSLRPVVVADGREPPNLALLMQAAATDSRGPALP